MINVYNKKCPDCDKIPHFNYKGEKYGMYCSEHKKDKMINVNIIICQKDDCIIRARYANPVTRKIMFCKE